MKNQLQNFISADTKEVELKQSNNMSIYTLALSSKSDPIFKSEAFDEFVI